MGIVLSGGVNGFPRRPAKLWCRDFGSGVVEGFQSCRCLGVVKVLWLCSKSSQGILWVFCHERRVNFGKNISVLVGHFARM